jgi:hypothetical protein
MVRTLKRLLPSGRQSRRILFGPARGAIMPLDLQCELRIFLGIYERELWPHYRALLHRGVTAFDIGGRDGYCALLINAITDAPVVSFEADADASAQMCRTFELNDAPLRAVHAFVGESGLALDAAATRYGLPGFLKIDVEGGEVDVLRSGPHVLSHRPAIIVEVHGPTEERGCIELLEPLGYRIRIVDRAGFMKEERPLAHNRWLACHDGANRATD